MENRQSKEQAGSCPTRQELADFCFGRLCIERAQELARHVEQCPDCESSLQALETQNDSLLDALQAPEPAIAPEGESRLRGGLANVQGSTLPLTTSSAPSGPPASLTARAGLTIGQYELLEEVGSGGMGTVYKALHTRLKRIVALKMLPRQRSAKPEAIERFRREMEAVGRLEHPNLVRATDAAELDGHHFLVMELLEGMNLAQLVERDGPLPAADACEIIRQAATGLQYAHERGLVHRDIKPSNIMLTTDGQVKVLDMGLARLGQDSIQPDEGASNDPGQTTVSDRAALTTTNQVLGTAAFMAPEQFDQSRTVDITADIYSLGCTLYFLLTGKPPFAGPKYQSFADIASAHANEWPPSIETTEDGIDQDLVAIIERVLAKEPASRFATPAEVADALQSFVSDSQLLSLHRNDSGLEHPSATNAGAAHPSPQGSGATLAPGSTRPPGIGIHWMLVCLAIVVTAVSVWTLTKRWLKSPIESTTQPGTNLSSVQTPVTGEPVSGANDAEPALLGILSQPQSSPGIGRWQLETASPRCQISSVAWHPSGDRIAYGTDGGLIRIHRASDQELIAVMIGHQDCVNDLAWSPDGSLLGSVGEDKTVRIWNGDGKPVKTMKELWGRPQHLAWHVNSRLLAVAEHGGLIKVFDNDGKLCSVFSGHSGHVSSVAWSPDGHWLASGGEDKTVRLWPADGTKGHTLTGHSGKVNALAWSADGKWLASAGDGPAIRCWGSDGTQGPVFAGFEGHVLCLAWRPDNRGLLTGGNANHGIRLWTLDDSKGLIVQSGGHPPETLDIAWNPDGTGFISAHDHHGAWLWNSAGVLQQEVIAPARSMLSTAWRPDGQLLASAHFDGTIRLWKSDGTLQHVLRARQTICAVSWSPDGAQLASASRDYTVRLWRPDGAPGPVLTGHTNLVHGLGWRPDSKRLASASHDGTIRIWEADGSPVSILKGPKGMVRGVAWKPNSPWLAGAHWRNGVRLWQEDGTAGPVLSTDQPLANHVGWRPDGDRLAIAGSFLSLWDMQTNRERRLAGHTGPVRELDWSPDGQQLASASADHTIRLWDSEGEPAAVVRGHTSTVHSVAWAPDSRHFASTCIGGALKVWDAKTLQPQWIAVMLDQEKSVTLRPDGTLLDGRPEDFDEHFAYFLEMADGHVEVLKPPEFRRRVGSPPQP